MKRWIWSLAVLGIGCVHREPQAPSVPSFSTPSGSFGSSYVSSAPQSAQSVVIQADLIVRPDTVCFPILIEARQASSAAALLLAKESLERVRLATKGDVRVDDVSARRLDEEGAPAWVSVRAVVERPLPDADVFERASVVAEMTDALEPFRSEANKALGAPDPSKPKIVIGAAEPGLKDSEQHRQRLLDGWAARVKALARTTDDATITLVNCSAPGEVRITGGTLEKVGLTLPIACTIGIQPRAK